VSLAAKRLLSAALDGLIFALTLWGFVSLFGAPHFIREHHLTEAFVLMGLIFACGSESGERTERWFR
jgi:hypothetical protein